jgi:hypothetical protein
VDVINDEDVNCIDVDDNNVSVDDDDVSIDDDVSVDDDVSADDVINDDVGILIVEVLFVELFVELDVVVNEDNVGGNGNIILVVGTKTPVIPFPSIDELINNDPNLLSLFSSFKFKLYVIYL